MSCAKLPGHKIKTFMRPTLRNSLLLLILSGTAPAFAQEVGDWAHYGGDEFGQRYSPLSEIDRNNVKRLEEVWVHHTGELGEGFARADKLAFEATPILIDATLYLTTPTNIVIALDAATGVESWRYDAKIDRGKHYSESTSRGVSAWREPYPKAAGVCTYAAGCGLTGLSALEVPPFSAMLKKYSQRCPNSCSSTCDAEGSPSP